MKRLRFYSLLIFSITLTCQLLGMISLVFIPTSGVANPLTVFYLLKFHFYREVLISLSLIAFISLLIFLWFQGGINRIISQTIAGIILLILLGLSIGLLSFSVWDNYSPYQLLNLLSVDMAYKKDLKLCLVLGFLAPLGLLLLIYKDKWANDSKILGNAHFASGLEVYRAGFLKQEDGAILIGKKYGTPLWSNGFEHVLVFAPTGSGKTRSIARPNLLQYPYSVVCNDVKLSLYDTTAQYRETILGHQCFCWAPAKFDSKTHRYNPFAMISKDKNLRITDIQRIAHILIPDSQKSEPIWQQASRKLFKAILLYLLDTDDRPTTLGEINRIIKQQNFDDWLAAILEENESLDPACYQNGYSYLNNHEKTRGSILETLSGYFELFEDPIIDNATSHSDFDLRDLRRQKMTIYIGFTDDDMERLAPLLTLFWQQLISAMIQKIPEIKTEPYPLLCLIDEFSSLGRIERLRRSLKLLREYRVRCVLMLQYIAQTYEQYSEAEAKAFTNIKTKIAFACDDYQDAEYVSKLLGTRTVKVGAGSSSRQAQGYSESNSYNYQAVPLLRPDEVMRLPAKVNLILRTGVPALKAGQYI